MIFCQILPDSPVVSVSTVLILSGVETTVTLRAKGKGVTTATDLAEFLGAALGFYLLFHIPLLPAALLTGVVTLLILALERRGFRPIEAVITVLMAVIALCYLIETVLDRPDWLDDADDSTLIRVLTGHVRARLEFAPRPENGLIHPLLARVEALAEPCMAEVDSRRVRFGDGGCLEYDYLIVGAGFAGPSRRSHGAAGQPAVKAATIGAMIDISRQFRSRRPRP